MKYKYCLLAGLLLSLGGTTLLTSCSEDFSGQIEILYNLIQGMESRVTELENQIKALEEKLNNLEPGSYDDTELRLEINNLKNELNDLKNRLEALKQQQDSNQADIQAINKELDVIQGKLNILQNAFANRIQSATFRGTVGQLTYTGATSYKAHFKIDVSPYESASAISADEWKKYLTLTCTKDINGTAGPAFTVSSVTTSKSEEGTLLLTVEADADFGQIYWKNEDGDLFTGYSLNAHIDNRKAAGDLSRVNMNVQGGLQLLFVAADRIDADRDYTFVENGKVIKTAEDSGYLRFDESNTYQMPVLGNQTYKGITFTQITDSNQPIFTGKVTAKSPDGKYSDLDVTYTVVSVYKDRLTEIVALPRAYVNIHENSALYMSRNLWEAENYPATNLTNHLVIIKLQAVKGNTSYGAPGYIAAKLIK